MSAYHKILTLYKRDPANNHKTLLDGQYACPEFEYLAGNEWVFTEKVDGTNIRVECGHGRETVALKGRTDKAQIPPFLLKYLEQTFTPDALRAVFPEDGGDDGDPEIVLYGEGYGARIQKGGGRYLPDRAGFILFDVRVGRWWLERHSVAEVAGELRIPIVPIVGRGTLRDAVLLAETGFKSYIAADGDTPAEGLVMRPAVEMFGRDGRRVIAKVKHKDFKK